MGHAAGYSRGIVTHHFGSKTGLLESVVRDCQQFEVPGAGTGPGLTQLTGLIAAYLKNLGERPLAGQAFLLMWTEALGADSPLAPLYAERDRWFRGLLADMIRTGIGDHSLRPETDPNSSALTVAGLLRGVGLQLISDTINAPDLDLIAEQTVTLIIGGIANHARTTAR